MEGHKFETLAEGQNVQQPTGMTGQVNNQTAVVDTIVGEGVSMMTEDERLEAESLAELEALRIKSDTDTPPEEPALSVDGVGFFALNDIHAVKAKQKQGKTTSLKVCAAALLKGSIFSLKSELQQPTILWLDTEQKAADVKLVINDIAQMTGLDPIEIDSRLRLYQLRKKNYETLLHDTRLLIKAHQSQVVIIDGVVDYVSSFNDEVESHQLIHNLLLLCDEFHCAIINVLHENKGADDRNMRGHLGTMLANAAGTVLECVKSKTGVSTVSCPDPRHGITPPWSIRFDSDGHIVDADAIRKEEQMRQAEKREQQRQAEREKAEQEKLDLVLAAIRESGGTIKRNELSKKLEDSLKVSRPTVSKLLSKFIKDRKIFEADKVITATVETALPF